jgi:hypothetical protein
MAAFGWPTAVSTNGPSAAVLRGELPRERSGVGDLKVAATPSPQRHQHKAVPSPPSQRGTALRTKTLGAAAGAQ